MSGSDLLHSSRGWLLGMMKRIMSIIIIKKKLNNKSSEFDWLVGLVEIWKN